MCERACAQCLKIQTQKWPHLLTFHWKALIIWPYLDANKNGNLGIIFINYGIS